MTAILDLYKEVAGEDVIQHLQQLARPLSQLKVVHVNSTRMGGGVAEILARLVPLERELGIDASWEVISGDDDFFDCTKKMHNALQGDRIPISESLLEHFLATNRTNAELLRPTLEEADMVFIHDPQPAPLISLCTDRRGQWVWRCHIDVSKPYRRIWKFLRQFLDGYEASIFSLADFAQPLHNPQYLISPSTDPLSPKNEELPADEVDGVYDRFHLDRERPLLVQVSRFDRFKDPVGVIEAFRLVRSFGPPVQLVLAGGTASDDPEGEAVLKEVREAANDHPDIHILLLPPDSHRDINALQRCATIAIQKSVREGFGLTVTESMWKGKPVIGGATGGIRSQVVDHFTGFLVSTPEGAAMRIRYLLHHPDRLEWMGAQAREFVRENFLITRLLREHLTLMVGLKFGAVERIVLG